MGCEKVDLKGFEIKIERECSTCQYRHHLGNRCMYNNFGCREHEGLPKWKLHESFKLSIIEKVMKA